MTSYYEWLDEVNYLGDVKATNQDAMAHFFYDGLDPFIKKAGYSWSTNTDRVVKKFIHLCYDIADANQRSYGWTLVSPEPNHRNFMEDLDTFDYFLDSVAFLEFLEDWKCYDAVVGTRFDFAFREFCYTWINVESGKPGKMTREILDSYELVSEDEQQNQNLPEAYSRRNKNDLY